MFFENELIGTVSFPRSLFAVLIGFAPVAVTLAVKQLLYRRHLAEDEALPPRQSRKTRPSERSLEDFAIFLASGIENFRHRRRCLSC